MSAPKFINIKKPGAVEAVQFDGSATGFLEISSWMHGNEYARSEMRTQDGGRTLADLNCSWIAQPGDWVLKDDAGEFFTLTHETFVACYEPVMSRMSFAKAFEALLTRSADRIARAGWNGKDQWVAVIYPGNAMFRMDGVGSFEMQQCLGLKNAQSVMQPGWVPSQGDLFATDWVIVE